MDADKPRRPKNLSKAQVRVLGVIAASCGEIITKSEIAEAAECTVKTVDRAVVQLKELGLIDTIMCYGENGAQVGSSYVVHSGAEDGE